MSAVPPGPRVAFTPPPYPYDRLAEVVGLAAGHSGGAVDLSVGTPCDPPPDEVVRALGSSGTERGYPTATGSADLRGAAAGWVERRFGVVVDPAHVAACVGTKELVATVPWLLRLGRPDRDTVLYPAVSYPTYAMGAYLAGCRAVGVPATADGGLDLDAVDPDDARRCLLLWVNSPANPTGALCDLGAAAAWGRVHGVPVFSDECYTELTWAGPPRTIVEHGTTGVVAVHSLSKRSNLAGVRVGCYLGDAELVGELAGLRRHVGLMVPGPVQAAAVVAWGDDTHVEAQRERYRWRLERVAAALRSVGVDARMPGGGFYLWVPVPAHWSGADGWDLARALARSAGLVTAPGDLYGQPEATHVRVAVVAPDDRIEAVARRIEAAGADGLAGARMVGDGR
ncbi:MAG: aminotransferase class I/II-fold pyridoxal phosphate-dependent enzyme [Actinomycetota bacterium]|nr:aminotransferase class I/II-fold pyridoxal phosphate-dependent enzyme [Actinomycetota bacterium]